MSANARVAAGRGGRGNNYKNRQRQPPPKPFISDHTDPAMQKATFTYGGVADATKFNESVETYATFISRSGRDHADHLRSIVQRTVDALPTIPQPDVPDLAARQADPFVGTLYIEEKRRADKKQDKLDVVLQQLHGEIWEQCTLPLKAKLKGEEGFEAVEAAQNPLELMRRIQRVCCGFEAHKMKFYALAQAMKRVMTFYQRPNMSNEEYTRQFDALWDTVVQFGGSLTNHTPIIQSRAIEIAAANNRLDVNGVGAPNNDDTAAATTDVDNRMKACFLLSGANNDKFHSLKDHLENQYTMGVDQYPSTPEALLGMMNNFRLGPGTGNNRRARGQQQQSGGDDDDGLAFVQEGDEDGEDEKEGGVNMAQRGSGEKPVKADIKAPGYPHAKKKCYHCNGMGHIARDCPGLDEKQTGQIMAQFGYTLLQNKKTAVKPNYLYLDTCSTDNYMCNQAYLKGVHTADRSLYLQTNGGGTSTNKQGYLGSILMWLGNTGIANVISLKALENKCRELGGHLKYNSEEDGGAFVANLGNGEIIPFKRCPDTDFPFIDLDDHGNEAVMLLQSVRKNFEGFSRKEVERAIHARDAQAMMGYPSEQDLKAEG